MSKYQKWVWIAAIATVVGAAAPATAQQSGIGGGLGSTGGIGGSSGGIGGSSGGMGGGIGGSSGGMGGGTGSNGLGGTSTQSNIPSMLTFPSSLQSSNPFAGYYSNPYAMGLNSTGTGGAGGGGSSAASFGSPVYGTSTGTNTTSTGAGGGRGGAGGLGGGGAGGLGGQNSSSANQSGIIVPIQSQMNYAALAEVLPPPSHDQQDS